MQNTVDRQHRYFQDVAKAGGTGKSIVATTGAALTAQLKAKIGEIIAEKLSFTAPAITATIEKGGSLYQAQFDYQQNKEWVGTLTRTKINPDGSRDENHVDNWSAQDKVPPPASRKLWSIIPGTDYTADYNLQKRCDPRCQPGEGGPQRPGQSPPAVSHQRGHTP